MLRKHFLLGNSNSLTTWCKIPGILTPRRGILLGFHDVNFTHDFSWGWIIIVNTFQKGIPVLPADVQRSTTQPLEHRVILKQIAVRRGTWIFFSSPFSISDGQCSSGFCFQTAAVFWEWHLNFIAVPGLLEFPLCWRHNLLFFLPWQQLHTSSLACTGNSDGGVLFKFPHYFPHYCTSREDLAILLCKTKFAHYAKRASLICVQRCLILVGMLIPADRHRSTVEQQYEK